MIILNKILTVVKVGQLNEHMLRGTVVDINNSPVERYVSIYKKRTNSVGQTYYEIYNTSKSDISGAFVVEFNDLVAACTVIIHGEDGENDVIFKDVYAPK